MASFTIEAEGLRQLSKDLRQLDKKAGRRISKALRTSAGLVATEARSRAAWSSRIPGTVRARATQRQASVVAGGANAPHAVVFEGRKDGGARAHPVFARGPRPGWTWVRQPPRPYLKPAADAKIRDFAEQVVDALAQAITETGG